MPDVDYDALAKKHGATVDYDSLAQKHGGLAASSDESSPVGNQQDAVSQMLNYHTGNKLVDAPMGVLQGAGKGAMSSGLGALELISKANGQPNPVDPAYKEAVTKPSGVGQGTGKFLEQAAEFAVPDAAAGDVLKGAGLGYRMLAKAGTGAGVAAVQSGGDKGAMLAGGVLGGAGEALSPALRGIKVLAGNRAPNLQNYADSFAATPSQKAVVGKALPVLVKDGITPTKNPVEMQGLVKGQLGKLSQQYQALDPGIASRTTDATDVMQQLQNAQNKFVSNNGHVLSENRASYDMIGRQINDVASVADQQSGQVTFKELQKLRDGANGKTDWKSPKSEKDLYGTVGDIYRGSMDKVAPETTPLNQDWATYKQLENVADENVSYGRGTTESGLDRVMKKAADRTVGATFGTMLGHATGVPGAAIAGGVVGGLVYPKLAGTAAAALKNAADSGALANLGGAQKQLLQAAMKAGNNDAVVKILAATPQTAATKTISAQ